MAEAMELALANDEPTLSELQQMTDDHEDRIQMLEEILIKAGLLTTEERIPNLPLVLTESNYVVRRPLPIEEESDEDELVN